MYRPDRLSRLLVVVAIALLACAPHRTHGQVRLAPAGAPADVVQVALTPIGLEPVVIKRFLSAHLVLNEGGRRLVLPAVAVTLTVLAGLTLGRRRTVTASAMSYGGRFRAVASIRLRAPPLAT